jgi:putative hydrolase of the HAD superfamily
VTGPPWTPRLIIFDVYNSIVLPRPGHRGTFEAGLRQRGVRPDADRFDRLQHASEGLAHPLPSASRDAYVDWCDETLATVAEAGVTVEVAPRVIPALEQRHQGRMEPLPGVIPLLAELRSFGVMIGVCSNWSWDLSDDLAACGLADLIDVTVSSARAGFRKPHPQIYRHVLHQADVRAAEALFVGDSERADVTGPTSAGIPAVHLVRTAGRSAAEHSISDIGDLRSLLRLPRQRAPG